MSFDEGLSFNSEEENSDESDYNMAFDYDFDNERKAESCLTLEKEYEVQYFLKFLMFLDFG